MYLPIVYLSITAFFGGLFVIGATTCFWTIEASEAINIFTYGGSYMLTYPMHIYADWLRKFFTYLLPGALIVYYPALYFLDKPDPTGLSPLMAFLSPLVGVGVLTASFVAWHMGLRRYTSTGS
jgi:ABC-2 type transport system permease protein